MKLNCETVLDVYTYKNRKILCQIKFNSNSGKFKNCRCLSDEQWMVFDENLEKLIATTDDWNKEQCLKFNINPCILVKIQKSSLSLKHFNKCLGTTSDFDKDLEEGNYILECLFDFKREFLFSPSIDSQTFELLTETSLDCAPCSPLSYDPYTPSKNKYATNNIDTVKTPGIDFLKCDESTNSPRSISGKETNILLSTEIMGKLETTNSTRRSRESNRSENLSEAAIDTEHETESWLNAKSIKNNPKEKYVVKKEITMVSPKKDRSLQIKSSKSLKIKESLECGATEAIKQDLNSQADKSSNPTERSKSEHSLLELNDENAKEKHRSKRKKHKTDKITRKRSRTLNEFPEEFFPVTKKLEMENINKERHKRTETASHSGKEKKKVSSPKGERLPEKEAENLLTEDEATSRNTKTTPKTPPTDISNTSESTIEMSPEKEPRRQRKLKSCSKDTIVSLRRSERSPNKPKRFIEELTELFTKSRKKHKSPFKNKELFGTDDDDDLFETKTEKISSTGTGKKVKSPLFATPVGKKPVELPLSSSSKKNTRKRDKSAECQQEKRDISKWLSKKNSKPLDHEAKTTPKSASKSSLSKLSKSTNVKAESDSKSRSKSVTPPPKTIELPSKEELELMRNKTSLMREENARMKAELDKMRTSPPKEVKILSLDNIPEDKILGSFATYKDELDEIYENNRKRDYIKGHDGINHCFIIRLLQQSIQMKMLEKLTNVYECSRQATLFANALLPEWVIRVYMEEFKFNRQQAIDQIKAQEAFQLHMEEQNENTFEFD